MKYGYIRVSSRDQNIERQLTPLLAIGIITKNLFIDKISGKTFHRENYQKMLQKLKEGDELYIKSIDRLGRNYDEILKEWNRLTKIIKVDIIVLDFPLLDTRSRADDLTGKFIADLVLQILSYVAQVERENTHQRQKEGILEAKKKGVKFGRPAKKIPSNFRQVAKQWKKGNVSLRKAAALLKTNHTTVSKWLTLEGFKN
ncbi:recombinase family protein [Streptococcus sp. E17BB]|uniref:recombinase family protein n=1 Tax=Streptococcus sp. E17BB TaxID=3278714 RepID=UPI00359EE347